MTIVTHNADAQTRSSSHPIYSGDNVTVARTLANVFDPKQVSTFTRTNQYESHLSAPTQHKNFVNMIASPSSSALHADSWESAM